MATILDVTILENFAVIIGMVFVMAVVFGILETIKIFGANRGLNILIAVLIGLLVLIFPDITKIIAISVPWFTMLFLLILVMLIAYKMLGATDADIASALTADRTIVWVVAIVCIVIVIAAASSVFGQKLLTGEEAAAEGFVPGASTSTESFSANVGATFFHPKILGLILIFMVAVFTMAILGGKVR